MDKLTDAGGNITHVNGMTLRDYFAGQVLAGQFSGVSPQPIDADWMRQHGAGYAYDIADAMLEARK